MWICSGKGLCSTMVIAVVECDIRLPSHCVHEVHVYVAAGLAISPGKDSLYIQILWVTRNLITRLDFELHSGNALFQSRNCNRILLQSFIVIFLSPSKKKSWIIHKIRPLPLPTLYFAISCL